MTKAFKYVLAYVMWFVDLGLSVWLFYLSRTTLLALLAVFNKPGDWWYAQRAILTDRVFTVISGIGLLVFFVITEEYFRTGALREGLDKRFATVTGPLVLCIFIVDLILFGLQGSSAAGWLRRMIFSIELVTGLFLVVYARKKGTKAESYS